MYELNGNEIENVSGGLAPFIVLVALISGSGYAGYEASK
ncbi:class IIb bacteriocin, lactobin A/cerein 7B family [Alteromonas oceanisediminis]|nr:class IIb bacteriocin, lactobin A/cerein 7B family [Alteromonas oceanisediminis]MBT0587169.1 class IIb bacteriocin, lactobin A/cerein 7B family [Alteromonas oceanisediminis]